MKPNLVVVGTTKGGTSTLHLWLEQHPDIAMTRRKELHYWCACPDPKLRVAANLDEYLGHFRDARIRGESSPCYLYYPTIPKRLTTEFPELRVVVSLRDPVERFWSHYLMNEIYRPTGLTPEEILERNIAQGRTNALDDLFGVGLYAEQIERYLEEFGSERVFVTFLETMASNPQEVASRVVEFLEVSSFPIDTDVKDKVYVEPRGRLGRLALRNPAARKVGVAFLPARTRHYLRTRILGDQDGKPTLGPTQVTHLRNLYRDDCRRLEQVVGTLPWDWHRSSSDSSAYEPSKEARP